MVIIGCVMTFKPRSMLLAGGLLVVVPGLAQTFARPLGGHGAAPIDVSLSEAQQVVARASLPGARFTGPESGPSAQANKSIALVAEDLRNGGIVGVAQGVRQAVLAIGWALKVFDAGGTAAGRSA